MKIGAVNWFHQWFLRMGWKCENSSFFDSTRCPILVLQGSYPILKVGGNDFLLVRVMVFVSVGWNGLWCLSGEFR